MTWSPLYRRRRRSPEPLIMISIRDHDNLLKRIQFKYLLNIDPFCLNLSTAINCQEYWLLLPTRPVSFPTSSMFTFQCRPFSWKENSSEPNRILIDEATKFCVDNKIFNTTTPHFVVVREDDWKIARKINFWDDGSETCGGLLINDESFWSLEYTAAVPNLARLAYLEARFRANWYFSVNRDRKALELRRMAGSFMQISSVSRGTREGTENNRESLWFMWCFIDSEIDGFVLNSRVRHLIEMWRRSKTKHPFQSRHVGFVFVVGIKPWL